MKTQAQEMASYIQEEYEKELNKRNSAESPQSEENSEECSRSERNLRSSTEKQENSRSSAEIKENSAECSRGERNSGECFKTGKQVSTIPSLHIRINNLQFRSTSQSSGEFIKWSVNPLHNNLLSYLDNGWEDHGDYITKSHCSMQKSLFSLSETCITIGYLEANKNENCCNLSSVGPRILDLSLSERNDFFEVYTLAESKLLALSNESENEN